MRSSGKNYPLLENLKNLSFGAIKFEGHLGRIMKKAVTVSTLYLDAYEICFDEERLQIRNSEINVIGQRRKYSLTFFHCTKILQSRLNQFSCIFVPPMRSEG